MKFKSSNRDRRCHRNLNFLTVLLIICVNSCKSASVEQVSNSNESLTASTEEDHLQNGEPVIPEAAPSPSSELDLAVPHLENASDVDHDTNGTESAEVPVSDVSQEVDKVGIVKRRAIRSLMKIFGLGDESILMREDGQFGPAPEFMIDLYNTITDTQGVTRAKNPYGAHVIRSFMERDTSKYDFFYFNLTASGKLEETEKVVEAELHLYRNPTPHERLHPSLYLTPFYILSLYQVVDSRNLGIPDLHKLLGVHYVPALGSGWEVFNVTQPVTEWLRGEKQNLGLIVAATSLGGDRVPVTFSRRTDASQGEKSNKQPILVLFNHDSEVEKLSNMISPSNKPMNRGQSGKDTERKGKQIENDDGNEEDNSAPILPNIPTSSLENPRFHHSLLYQDTIRHPNSVSRFRSRRSKNQTEGETTEATTEHPRNVTSCSKHDLFISFEAIGWSSWIISPKGYNAFYCTGPCVFPLSHEVSPTNHATLQSIAHELSLATDVGRPCCVPTKLLPISLLYYDDDDNVVLKQYVDMVADTCGCH